MNSFSNGLLAAFTSILSFGVMALMYHALLQLSFEPQTALFCAGLYVVLNAMTLTRIEIKDALAALKRTEE